MNGNSRALYNQYNGIANFLPRSALAWTPFEEQPCFASAFSRSSFQEGTGEYNRLATNAPWNVDLSGQWTGTNGIPANQVYSRSGLWRFGLRRRCLHPAELSLSRAAHPASPESEST